MIPSTDRDGHGFRDVWGFGLAWFRRPPSSAEKRAKQAELVNALLARLREEVHDLDALDEAYCGASRARIQLARTLFPTEWPSLCLHAVSGTAFGLRYVELITGQRFDARDLPPWLGEWSIP